MKKLLSIFLSVLLVVTCIPLTVFAESADEITRYSVLILDVSGEASFTGDNGSTIYTADSAIEYVKESAKTFLSNLIKANGNNYVAVITYSDYAEVVSDFTDDIESVSALVDSLKSEDKVRNMSDGLIKAEELLSNVDENATKNAVLVTTGMVNAGDYSYDGLYDESSPGSIWRRMDTQVRLYAYANFAYEYSLKIKEKSNLYVLGLFKTMEDMPDEGKDIAQFFRTTARDVATSDDTFFEIEDPSNIGFYFGEVSDDIINPSNEDTFIQEHIDFVNNDSYRLSNLSDIEIFKRTDDIAFADDEINTFKFLSIAKDLLGKGYFDSDEIFHDELTAQMVLTQILYNEGLDEKIRNNIESKEELFKNHYIQLLSDKSYLLGDDYAQKIAELMSYGDKSSDSYKTERDAFLEEIGSSPIDLGSVKDIAGGFADYLDYNQITGADRVGYGFSIAGFLIDYAEENKATWNDINNFFINSSIYLSCSDELKEALNIFKTRLLVELHERQDWRDLAVCNSFIDYLNKVTSDSETKYLEYCRDHFSEFNKKMTLDASINLYYKGLELEVASVCPEFYACLKAAHIALDVTLDVWKLFSTVDERAEERDLCRNLYVLSQVISDTFSDQGTSADNYNEYFLDKPSLYSVGVYEEGVAIYKEVLEMYKNHSIKYYQLLYQYVDFPFSSISKIAGVALDNPDEIAAAIIGSRSELKKQIYVNQELFKAEYINLTLIQCHKTDYIPVTVANKTKFYYIACPVNITISNENGISSQIINDELSVFVDDPNVLINVLNNEEGSAAKSIIVPYDYTVEISGYAEGLMKVEKMVMENGVIIDSASFENIPVISGVHYAEVIDGDHLIAINGYDNDGNHVSINDTLIDNTTDPSSDNESSSRPSGSDNTSSNNNSSSESSSSSNTSSNNSGSTTSPSNTSTNNTITNTDNTSNPNTGNVGITTKAFGLVAMMLGIVTVLKKKKQ